MTQPEDAKFVSIPAQYGRLVSLHLPCEGISLAQFLQAGRGQARFYWESSRDNLAFAGIGTALEIFGYGKDRFETIRHHAIEIFGDEKAVRKKIMGIVMDSRTPEEPKPDADKNIAIHLLKLVAPQGIAADFEQRLRMGVVNAAEKGTD